MMERKLTFKGKIRSKLVETAYALGKFTSKIYSFNLRSFWIDWQNSFHSGWIYRNFKSCGANNQIAFPLYCVGPQYISIGDNFISGPNFRIEAHNLFLADVYNPKIKIGNSVNINFDCHIGCVDEVIIGNNVLIASKVLIIDHFHGDTTYSNLLLPPVKRRLVTKGPIKIGDNVWIGESVVIMPGVELGENCIVGANSVVTKSFGSNMVLAGNPAKVIRKISINGDE